jgi:NADH:ubiquinone oxidoreductase subunit C
MKQNTYFLIAYFLQLTYRKFIYCIKFFLLVVFYGTSLKCNIQNNFLEVQIINNQLLSLLSFCKNHSLLQVNYLVDCCIVDCLSEFFRFHFFYYFNSIFFNSKLSIITTLAELFWAHSLTYIFSCTLWLEREVWDMYGIFFWKHPDLRRLLSDYGFKGFPLRKDFPLIGFYEVFYKDPKKKLEKIKVILMQKSRVYRCRLSW